MNVSPDYAAYDRKQAAIAALWQEALPMNKATLFDALQAAGIHTVSVEFDGYGDSGQIEAIRAFTADNTELPLPDSALDWRDVLFDEPRLAVEIQPVRDAIEGLAYRLLGDVHYGWENNDGAYGTFSFDVNERAIVLDYHERFTDSTHYAHAF